MVFKFKNLYVNSFNFKGVCVKFFIVLLIVFMLINFIVKFKVFKCCLILLVKRVNIKLKVMGLLNILWFLFIISVF